MSYKTVEVQLEDGRVRPANGEALPAKARALLTIMAPIPEATSAATRTLGVALRELGAKGRGEHTDLSTDKRHLDDFGQ